MLDDILSHSRFLRSQQRLNGFRRRILECRHGAALHFELYGIRRHAQHDVLIPQANDRAMNSAAGNHPVAILQVLKHFLLLLLPALIGQKQEKIED